MSARLLDLYRLCGQSPWLDNLRRRDILDGRLHSLVKSGIRGVTSNPTIFQKSIQGSHDYDAQFFPLIDAGMSVRDAYWELVITDITGALDVLGPVHQESHGGDGFVSLEVDPSLAHDTDATIRAARELWRRIDRPNLMVKIPATRAGIPAIRALIAEGVNVNVTLIFSIPRYREVVDAYIAGLTDLASRDGDVASVSSVASFFISRVDTEVDARLATLGVGALQGTAAITQAMIVYEDFRDLFSAHNPAWGPLAGRHARPQRPLWASTSTKNPAYPDTMYVDRLIGPDTVNTLPEATMEAFADHGTVAGALGLRGAEPRAAWEELTRVGVDMESVAETLEREGVAAFIDSFEDLIGTLQKRASSRT